jgi:hypothetical protein
MNYSSLDAYAQFYGASCVADVAKQRGVKVRLTFTPPGLFFNYT